MLFSGKQWQSLLLLLFFSTLLSAQELSPYSRFGLGERSSFAFAASKAMGRLAAGYRDPLNVNMLNPASYSDLAFTTLETGFKFTTKNITDGQTQQSYRAGDGFLDYLAFGFPTGSKAGISFGIVPYSEMNYNFNTTRTYDTIITQRQFTGEGRTYKLYAGAGYRYPKSDTSKHTFSLGLNFAYIFGNLYRNDILSFSELGYYDTRIASSTRVSNFALDPGVQYRRNLDDSLTVVIGAYGSFPVAVKSNEHVVWDRPVVLAGGTAIADTVFESTTDNENIRIPVDVGLGGSIGKMNKWMAGLEVIYSVWKNVEPFSTEATLQNSIEVRAGGEFRPNFRSQSLVKNGTYRLGAFYNNGYVEMDNQRIMEYGFTFGLAVPIKSLFSRLNFSFEVGNKGTTTNGLISETFFKTYIGLTFNDKWFIKPKYD